MLDQRTTLQEDNFKLLASRTSLHVEEEIRYHALGDSQNTVVSIVKRSRFVQLVKQVDKYFKNVIIRQCIYK